MVRRRSGCQELKRITQWLTNPEASVCHFFVMAISLFTVMIVYHYNCLVQHLLCLARSLVSSLDLVTSLYRRILYPVLPQFDHLYLALALSQQSLSCLPSPIQSSHSAPSYTHMPVIQLPVNHYNDPPQEGKGDGA